MSGYDPAAPLPYPPLPPQPTPAEEVAFERARWNHHLLDPAWRATRFRAEPNALLVATVQALPPGAALDVSMGEGRNALYLAARGWRVTGLDVAEQALAFARARAREQGLALTALEADVHTHPWGQSAYDLVVLSYAGGRPFAPRALAALRPGGRLVLEGFHRDALADRPEAQDQDGVFATDEVRTLYAAAGFVIEHYAEPIGVADFTRQTGRLVQLVARRPG